ncbi:hypothetical protein DB30_05207 [Enhygromyxa salina]|uniref:Uncharacterized protein n=1 Tax=Enhygromyxa salina TaxID=215803 RepID=A0A0C1ZDS3_9BACT|nr:hypothetical protein [Enhygromyxa salina]KIG15789.1 hypothetical protein DB30_05207 [Enhygromyxa salina]
MSRVPLEPNERDWLIARYAELIDAAGWRPFVRSPLLLPNQDCFPDAWKPSARGVRRLALRLLAYAGLEQLDVSVEVFDGDRPSTHHAGGDEHVSAWFAGIERGVCLFGCAREQLDDAIGVVGAMAHEVAHAFRRFHQLEVDDHDLEERLTDLTTVALGFGVLTTNAALRHRSSSIDGGNLLGGHQWSRDQLGYLPPAAMSFSLAIWWFARGNEQLGRKQISRALELNQRAWFQASLDLLDDRQTDLRSRLGLPVPERWPKPLDVAAIVIDEDEDDDENDDDSDDDQPESAPQGRDPDAIVFRLRRKLLWEQPAKFKLELNVLLAGWLAFTLSDAQPWFWGVSGTLVAIIGALWRTRWSDRCSDLDCDHQLDPGIEVCPGCRRPLAGTINDPSERLDAEERVMLERHTK